MNTTLSQPAACPNCAQPLPAAAPAGLCPACLLAQGLDTDPGGGKAGKFTPPPVEEIARLFPQLEILGLLGAGGMGAVYKARQPALDRLVALKVLPPQGATSAGGADSTERFNREARALARLSHPNIVAVHEFGQLGGLNFFIMEFVDGANLRQLGRTARLSPREALQIIPQICDALQYAHDEGVVHRDIKPENVLVDRRGRVKIADFGLAKIFGPDGDALRLTAEGDVMGTPHYMAPEQVERPLAVDHRADIYSLGVVFYELLTGDLPLGKFAPPSRKVSVDVRLDDVVLRVLENDPARRYQHASEVKSQVETIATHPAPPGSSRREEASIPPAPSRPSHSILRVAWTLHLLGTVMVLLHLAPRLLGRPPQASEGQLTPTSLAIMSWLGLGLLTFGVLWLMKQSARTSGFPRSLTAMSFGLLATAFAIYSVQGNSWIYAQHPRFMEWQLAWINALGVLSGWWAMAAMRGQAIGIGWRVLAAAGALAAVVMPMMAAFRVGAGQLMRWFPALRGWMAWGDGTGYLLSMFGLAVAAVAWLGHRAWSWSRGKRELSGQRLGLALACLVGSWVVSQHYSRVQNYAAASSHVTELPPGMVRLFQSQTSIGGSQGVSFSGRVVGLQPGWRLNAGWVALDGSGAGTGEPGSSPRPNDSFYFWFRYPTAFAVHTPQAVVSPRFMQSSVWELSPGARTTVFTVTNAVGHSVACFVEVVSDTPLTPLGNSAVAVQRGVARQPNGQPVLGSAGVSLTVAPRHVAAVGVFLRERDRLTPLPELSALLASPAGERVSRELHWEAMAMDNGATNVPPQVRVSMGVAGGLPRRAAAVLPEALAGYRLSPAGFSQEALLAAGELREWVLFHCAPIARGGASTRGEIVARLVPHPLAADWRPDLIQPHFRRGTNWAQLTQPNLSHPIPSAAPTLASGLSPRAPRGELTFKWHDVSVHPNAELIAQGPVAVSGSEMVLGRLRWSNGRVEESEASVRIHNASFPINSSLGVHFAFPANFPLALKEQAAVQLKSMSNSNQPLTLLAGQWRPVFSITNEAGESVTGEMTFSPGVPSTMTGQVGLEFPTNHPMQGMMSSSQLSLALRSDVPLGYRLLATAESPSHVRINATVNRLYRMGKTSEHITWFVTRPQTRELMAKASAQVRAFAARDSLRLKLGERKEVFRFTNDRGETFAGALELIAAP